MAKVASLVQPSPLAVVTSPPVIPIVPISSDDVIEPSPRVVADSVTAPLKMVEMTLIVLIGTSIFS